MAGDRKFRLPRPQGAVLWAPIAALLALGTLTTVIDLLSVPQQETARAVAERQRYTVNPSTGEVVLAREDGTAETPAEEFDVAAPEAPELSTQEEPAAEHAEAAPKEEAAEEAAPAPEDAHAEKTEESASAEEPSAEPAAETPTEPPADTPAPVAASEPPPPAGLPTLRTTPVMTDIATSVPRSADSLVPAPAREITETVDGLALPKRGDKGVTAATLYASPFKRKPEQVLLSFVVVDAGLNPQSIGLLLGMPKEISVAYSPYARKENAYSEQMRAMGHEVWTMLPAMTDRYPNDDPGPLGIISRMPAEEAIRRLREVLAAIPGSIGVVLPSNESLAAQKGGLASVIAELNTRGLFLLSTHPSRGLDHLTSDRTAMPMMHRADLLLDPEADESQIRSKLAGLIASATEKGEYLVVLSARPQTLELLRDWLKETKLEAPITLAPLSAMYQPKVEAAPKEEAPADDGHGGGAKKEKKKEKPKEKPPKPLPQDKYKQPPAGEKAEGGGHH